MDLVARIAVKASLSPLALKVIEVFSQGAGKTSASNINVLSEALEALGWGVEETVGLTLLDFENIEHLGRPIQLALGAEKILSGFTVNEPSNFVFPTEEAASQAAREIHKHLKVGIPTRPESGTLYVGKVVAPTYDSRIFGSGRWLLGAVRWTMGVTAWEFKAPNGGTLTVAPSLGRRGKPADATQMKIPKFWTWAYKNGIQQAAKEFLEGGGTALIQKQREERELAIRSLENTGTCPACFRNVKLVPSRKVISRHGWSVQDAGPRGYGGWHTGPCFGQGYAPFELSSKGTVAYRGQVDLWRESCIKRIEKLNSGEAQVPSDRSGKKMVGPDHQNYARFLDIALSSTERDLKMAILELRDLDAKIAAWTQKPLPGERTARRVDVRDVGVAVPEDAYYIRNYKGLDAYAKDTTIYLVDPRTKKVVRTQKTNNRVYSEKDAGSREVTEYNNYYAFWEFNDPAYRVYGVMDREAEERVNVGQITQWKKTHTWEVEVYPDWPHSDMKTVKTSFTSRDAREGVKRALMWVHKQMQHISRTASGTPTSRAYIPAVDRRKKPLEPGDYVQMHGRDAWVIVIPNNKGAYYFSEEDQGWAPVLGVVTTTFAGKVIVSDIVKTKTLKMDTKKTPPPEIAERMALYAQSAKKAAMARTAAGIVEAPHNYHPVEVQEAAKEPFVGFIDFQGIQIDVENKVGSIRSKTNAAGVKWETLMHSHYGEIRNTEGVDGDNLDVYVGPNHDSSLVVVIRQQFPDTGKYDEDKVMLGYDSVEEAIGAYKKQYNKPGFYQSHVSMPIGQFWRWVHDNRTKGRQIMAKIAKGATVKTASSIRIKKREIYWDDQLIGLITGERYTNFSRNGIGKGGGYGVELIHNGVVYVVVKPDTFAYADDVKKWVLSEIPIQKMRLLQGARAKGGWGMIPGTSNPQKHDLPLPFDPSADKLASAVQGAANPYTQALRLFEDFYQNIEQHLKSQTKVEDLKRSGADIVLKLQGRGWITLSLSLKKNALSNAILEIRSREGKSVQHQLPTKKSPHLGGFLAKLLVGFAEAHASVESKSKDPAPPERAGGFRLEEVDSVLRGWTTKNAGRILRVEYYPPGKNGFTEHSWSAEPEMRQRLDHYVGSYDNRSRDDGYDSEGWDEESWEREYAAPLRAEVELRLARNIGPGLFHVEIGTKGHIEVSMTDKGLKKVVSASDKLASRVADRYLKGE